MYQAQTYEAHIGSLASPNFLIATAGLQGTFFSEALQRGVTKAEAVSVLCDAARIYLRLAAEQMPLETWAAELPTDNLFELYKALLTAYKSEDEIARLVTRGYKIRTLPNPNIDRLAVIFDAKSGLFGSAANGVLRTTNERLNYIIKKYNLIVSKYYLYDQSCDSVTLLAQKPYNMAAIAKEIRELEGIVNVEVPTVGIGETDISMVKTKNSWLIEYNLFLPDSPPVAWLLECFNSGELVCHKGSYVPHAKSAKTLLYSTARPHQ